MKEPTTLDSVVSLDHTQTPTEMDHYQIQRAVDVYVTPRGRILGGSQARIDKIIAEMQIPGNVRVNLRGMVQGMRESFKSFGFGFILAAILLYLILVAQFRSFIDPFLIMLAIPMGFIGVLRHSADYRHDLECHVADGRADADWRSGIEQHSDCRLCTQIGRAESVGLGCRDHRLPRSLAADSDDLAWRRSSA